MQMKHFFSVAVLPLFLSHPIGAQSSTLTEWEQIHQTLNLYPIALDTKNWTLLPHIFTENAFVNYTGFQANARGIPAIRKGLAKAVADFNTQHLFGTTRINIASSGSDADAVVYLQATLFTAPQQKAGQYVNIYGQYQDHLVKTSAGWRISERVFELMGPGFSGNLTIVGK